MEVAEDSMSDIAGGAGTTLQQTPTQANIPAEGILKTIMSLRGLSITEESTFDFEPPEQWRQWPGARYGPDSPHTQFAKGTKSNSRSKQQSKRQPPQPSTPRPQKARKPKPSTLTKKKPEPSKQHGPVPKRDPPLHLLTLPGELRDIIYDLLAVHHEPLFPQIRPVQKPGRRPRGGQQKAVCRRFPLEPTLALVNHQLRKEVLSVFYGANRFVFRPSSEPILRALNMTSPAAQIKWYRTCSASQHLRNIELRLDAKAGRYVMLTYKLTKAQDGGIEITHSLTDSEYCPCLEDEAVAETLVMAKERDLSLVMYFLGVTRREKLKGVAKVDEEEDGRFKMPTAKCLYCGKANLTHVTAG